MPRNAPTDVTEHRITLGDFERKQLTETVNAYNRDKWLENVPYMVISVGAIGGATALGIAAYALYRFVGLSGEITQTAKNWANGFGVTVGEVVTGDPTLRPLAEEDGPNTTAAQCEAKYKPIIEDLEEALEQLKKFPFPINNAKARQKLQARIGLLKTKWMLCSAGKEGGYNPGYEGGPPSKV